MMMLLMSLVLMLAFVGCGSSEEAAEEPVEDAVEEEAATEEEPVTVDGNKYGYGGTDPAEFAVYQYMADVIATENYDKADVSIPAVAVVEKDESNPDDVLVKGDFWIYNYKIDGDTLLCVSGGNYAGCMHLAKAEDGSYTVTSFDQVSDGGNFEESAKEIFGDSYDKFMEVYSDSDALAKLRYDTTTVYVNANEVPCTKYQDEGWDPIDLHI